MHGARAPQEQQQWVTAIREAIEQRAALGATLEPPLLPQQEDSISDIEVAPSSPGRTMEDLQQQVVEPDPASMPAYALAQHAASLLEQLAARERQDGSALNALLAEANALVEQLGY
jgi:hypothetical protein